ncbi:MAG: prephenate dehydrogenase/arogenate dehydrogenase family protein [Desulfuromonadia bacterium]
MPLVDHLVVVGVGLIGGSLARVLREKGAVCRVTGVGRGVGNLERAVQLGVIDCYVTDPADAVVDADLVFLATPVCSIVPILARIAPFLKRGAVVTDGGSVKEEIVREGERVTPAGCHFIGGHPIAGTEHSGVEASFSTLFCGRRCILTPTPRTDPDAFQLVSRIWEIAGSEVVCMEPATHDRVVAAISHLPHMAAYALVNAVGSMDTGGENVLRYSAGGFRDFTRIASSDPEMWRDIALQNRDAILGMMDMFTSRFLELRTLIERGDREGMEAFFRLSKGMRDTLVLTAPSSCLTHSEGS